MATDLNALDDFVEEKLLHLHTAFLGKVISANTNSGTFDVQPLTLTKQYGKDAKKQAIISGILCLDDVYDKVSSGSTVLCIVCERDITEAKNGNSALPASGHHLMKDSVIIGTIGGGDPFGDSTLISENNAEISGSSGTMGAKAKKAVEWAMAQVGKRGFNSTRNGYCISTNWCARFVSTAYANGGSGYQGGNAIDFPHSNKIAKKNGKIDCSNIPAGACIVSKGYPVGGKYYGHVAIYAGKGYVVEAGGAVIRYTPIGQSIGARCGFLGWGVPSGGL